ncbi:ABC transporter substrate-binding protein [Candidatus Latescibacterota bacterium]
MLRPLIIIAIIILTYALVLFGALDHHEDHPRFSMKTPIPVEADTSKIDPGQYGGRVLIGAHGDPKTFNPIVASESSSRDINGRLYSSLISRDNITQETIPSLAHSWEFSEDMLAITFNMRRGVLWSDGEPVTAYDMEFTYAAVFDSLVQNSLNDILRVNGEPFVGTAIDSFTFKVSIPSPFAPFLMWAGSVPILPKHILQPEIDKGTFDSAYNISWPVENFVSSGPYLIEKYESGVKTVLRKNPNYWRVDQNNNRLPYLERIIHVNLRSSETMLLQFQTGDLDMLEITKLSDVPILEQGAEKGDYSVISLGTSLNQYMFWFNVNPGEDEEGNPYVAPHKRVWFNDVRWRKAMSHAVDRKGIADTVFGGLAQPMYGNQSPANKKWYNPNIIKHEYDLDKSGEYLDSMGLIDRDNDGVREDPDGNIVEFTMITNTGNDQRELTGNIIKDDLSKIGVKMNFNPIEFNTLIVKIDNEYIYECGLIGFGGGDPDPSSGTHMWLSSGRMHMWYPNQPSPATEWEARIDELMNLQITTLDEEKRKEYYNEVQYIISDMQPFIYLVIPEVFVAVKNKYQNMVPTMLSHRLLWNIEEVWTR